MENQTNVSKRVATKSGFEFIDRDNGDVLYRCTHEDALKLSAFDGSNTPHGVDELVDSFAEASTDLLACGKRVLIKADQLETILWIVERFAVPFAEAVRSGHASAQTLEDNLRFEAAGFGEATPSQITHIYTLAAMLDDAYDEDEESTA